MVAIRPRGVRFKTLSESSKAHTYLPRSLFSSPMFTDNVLRPTGLHHTTRSSFESASDPHNLNQHDRLCKSSKALSAIWRSMIPFACTCAKSRTRFSKRLAILGVPRDRRAISNAPSSRSPSEKYPLNVRRFLLSLGLHNIPYEK